MYSATWRIQVTKNKLNAEYAAITGTRTAQEKIHDEGPIYVSASCQLGVDDAKDCVTVRR